MEPYYALLMAQVKGSVSKSLERELKKETNDIHTIEEMSFTAIAKMWIEVMELISCM